MKPLIQRSAAVLAFGIVTVLFGAVLAVPAFAQATATFNGRITDQTGGVLPGVTVNATHVATGRVRTTVTNADGLYTLPGLDSGAYELQAELAGFGRAIAKDVTLTVGATLTMDFTLKPAAVEESVTVSGTASVIQATKSEVQSTLRTQELQELPMVNRNFAGLVALMPSARVGAPHDTTKQTMGGLSFGGSNGVNVNMVVDGGDNRDDWNGGLLMGYTLEGIEEFKLTTNRFSAAEGRTNGASLAIVTKSGSNTVAGTGFLFARSARFAAKDYFTEKQGIDKAPLSRQQYGGSLGGPLIRNKMFFFGAVEHIREKAPLTISQGVLRQLNLLTGYGAIPKEQIDRPYDDSEYIGKVNFQPNSANALFARLAGQNNKDKNHRGGIEQYDQGFPWITTNAFYNLATGWTRVFSPTLVNQATVQYQYWHLDQYTDPKGVHSPTENNLVFPSAIIGRSGGEYDDIRYFQIKDELSVQAGPHAIRVGGDYMWYPLFSSGIQGTEDGQFTFFDDPSVILSDRSKYPNGLQTPGAMQSWSAQTAGYTNNAVFKAKQFGLYFQDDWRVTPRLTLNVGARYDAEINFLNQTEWQNNRTYKALAAIGNPYGQLPKTDRNNVSPRVGFAYQVGGSDRTVLRGGYGLYYDKPTAVTIYFVLPMMKPTIIANASLTNTAIGVGELATFRLGINPAPAAPAALPELPVGGRTTGYWIDPKFQDPYNHQLHLGIAHQFGNRTALSVDAVDSRGYHEFRYREINYIQNGVRVLANTLGSVLGDRNLFGSLRIASSEGRSEYRSLQFKFEGRVPRFNYRATYELSSAYGLGGYIAHRGCCSTFSNDLTNFEAPGEWGPGPTDERHRIVLFGVFQLPYGFEVSPIYQFATARPYTLTAGVDLNGDGVNNDRYVDPATGEKVAVGSARGDNTSILDIRLTRFFGLGGKRRIAAFAEFFNVMNTVNFGNSFVGNARSPLFSQPNALAIGLGEPFRAQFGFRFFF